ncbi:hypothetical protein KCU88_g80, partial [Aureobasidium melanogenum]
MRTSLAPQPAPSLTKAHSYSANHTLSNRENRKSFHHCRAYKNDLGISAPALLLYICNLGRLGYLVEPWWTMSSLVTHNLGVFLPQLLLVMDHCPKKRKSETQRCCLGIYASEQQMLPKVTKYPPEHKFQKAGTYVFNLGMFSCQSLSQLPPDRQICGPAPLSISYIGDDERRLEILSSGPPFSPGDTSVLQTQSSYCLNMDAIANGDELQYQPQCSKGQQWAPEILQSILMVDVADITEAKGNACQAQRERKANNGICLQVPLPNRSGDTTRVHVIGGDLVETLVGLRGLRDYKGKLDGVRQYRSSSENLQCTDLKKDHAQSEANAQVMPHTIRVCPIRQRAGQTAGQPLGYVHPPVSGKTLSCKNGAGHRPLRSDNGDILSFSQGNKPAPELLSESRPVVPSNPRDEVKAGISKVQSFKSRSAISRGEKTTRACSGGTPWKAGSGQQIRSKPGTPCYGREGPIRVPCRGSWWGGSDPRRSGGDSPHKPITALPPTSGPKVTELGTSVGKSNTDDEIQLAKGRLMGFRPRTNW